MDLEPLASARDPGVVKQVEDSITVVSIDNVDPTDELEDTVEKLGETSIIL